MSDLDLSLPLVEIKKEGISLTNEHDDLSDAISAEKIDLNKKIDFPIIYSEGELLKCRQKSITAVTALSPTEIFVGSIDETIRFWQYDSKSSKWKDTSMKGHGRGGVLCFKLDKKNSRLFSGGFDKLIIVWNTQDKKKMTTYKGHEKKILSLEYNPESEHLYSASEDGTIKMWDTKNGNLRNSLPCPKVTFLKFSHDLSNLLASCGDSIKIFDPKLALLDSFDVKGETVTCLEMINQTQLVTGCKTGNVYVWNYQLKNFQVEFKINAHVSSVRSLLYFKGVLWTGSENRSIRTWDSLNGFKSIQTLRGHFEKILDPKDAKDFGINGRAITCFTESKGFIFSSSEDETIRIWNSKPLSDTASFEHEKDVHCFLVDNPHSKSYVHSLFTSSGKRTITHWDTEKPSYDKVTNYPTEFKGHKEKITCLALAADGILITASEDKSLRSWDTTHGTTLRQYKGHKDQILAISIVDEHIYSASLDGYILRWNIETGEYKKIATWSKGIPRVDKNAKMCLVVCEDDVDVQDSSRLHARINQIRVFFSYGTHEIFSVQYNTDVKGFFQWISLGPGDTIVDMKKGRLKADNLDFTETAPPCGSLTIEGLPYLLIACSSGDIHQYQYLPLTVDSETKINEQRLHTFRHIGVKCIRIVGETLYSGSDKSIRIWSISHKICQYELVNFYSPLSDLQVIDDYLFISSQNCVRKYNLNLYLSPSSFYAFHSKNELENLIQNNSDTFEKIDKVKLLKFLSSFGLVEPAKLLLRSYPELQFNSYEDSALLSALKNKRWSLLEDLAYINQRSNNPDSKEISLSENDFHEHEFAKHIIITPKHRDILSLLQKKAIHDDLVFLRGFYETNINFQQVEIDILAAFFLGNHNRPSHTKFLTYWLKYISDNTDAINEDCYGRHPLHYSTLFGSFVGTKMLMEKDDRTDINKPDQDGFTPLHLVLQQSANPLSTQRGTRSPIKLIDVRYDCIRYLLTFQGLREANLLVPVINFPHLTCYDFLLHRLGEDSEDLKIPLNEFEDAHHISYNKKKFEHTWKLTDHINSNKEEVKRYRVKWAFKRFLREIIPYLIWLVLLLIAAFHSTAGNSHAYWFTQNLSNRFINSNNNGNYGFTSINFIEDFWNWHQQVFLPNLALLEWNIDDELTPNPDFLSGNRLVGASLMRQLRTTPNAGCEIPVQFSGAIAKCFSTAYYQDTQTYGPPNYVSPDGSTPFQYTSDIDASFWGKWGTTYPGGGFVQLFTHDLNTSLAISQNLSNYNWIDSQTRVVLVTVTVFNVNYNLFGVLRLAVEFPGAGDAIPYVGDLETITAFTYLDSTDHAVAVIEVLVVIYFFIFFILSELYEMYTSRFEYLKDLWNYYEWFIIVLFCTVFALRAQSSSALQNMDLLTTNKYVDLQLYGALYIYEQYITSLIVILCLLRSLKFLKLMPVTGPATQAILDTLRDKSFIVFVSIFFFIIISFGLAFQLTFGFSLYEYRDVGEAIVTMFRMILGDFSYDDVFSVNRVFGPLFFVVYMFFVGIVLMNLFIAVLSQVYMDIKTDNDQSWEIYITNLMVEESRTYKWRLYYRKFRAYFNKYFRKDVVQLQKEEQQRKGEEEFSMADEEIQSLALDLKKNWSQQSAYDSSNASIMNELRFINAQLASIEGTLKTLAQKN